MLKCKLLREAANKKPEIDPIAKAHLIKHFIKDPTKEKKGSWIMIGRSESATATPRIGGLMQRPFPSSESSPNNRSLR